MMLQSMLSAATQALDAFSQRYCCAVLDDKGCMLLWFRSDVITPCSETLSTQKARTAFAFQANTEATAQKLGLSGVLAVSGNDYCFLPGGVSGKTTDGKTYYVGVSTENPEIDDEAAQAVMQSFG